MNEAAVNEVLEDMHKVRPEFLTGKALKLFNAIMTIADERDELKVKYNKALELLSNYPPCEIDDFMDKHIDYCSMECGVDAEIYKKCWNLYIEDKLKGNSNE